MRRPVVLLAAAVACIAAGGVAWAVTQHTSVGEGLYCALGTAATVGCDTAAHGSGRVVAVALMLTALPLLGAFFAQATSQNIHVRIAALAARHHREQLEQAAENHKALVQTIDKHREQVGDALDALRQASAQAGEGTGTDPAATAAAERVVPPPAAGKPPKRGERM